MGIKIESFPKTDNSPNNIEFVESIKAILIPEISNSDGNIINNLLFWTKSPIDELLTVKLNFHRALE